jgi:hypothetical protein
MPVTISGSGTMSQMAQGGIPGSPTIVAGTSVASTSGTSIDFTGIPSWVRRITVMFSGVSISGASQFVIQLGTSGGVVSTGYAGVGTRFAGAALASGNYTAGCYFANVTATTYSGSIIFSNTSSNLWTWSGQLGTPSATEMGANTAGGVNLGALLTRLRITTANGTDTYTAGTINILYE